MREDLLNFYQTRGFLGLNPENPVNAVQKSSGRNLRGRSPGLIAIYESKDYLFADGRESDTERSVVRSRRKDVRNHRNSCGGHPQHPCRAKRKGGKTGRERARDQQGRG